jgi:hypothetical protein
VLASQPFAPSLPRPDRALVQTRLAPRTTPGGARSREVVSAHRVTALARSPMLRYQSEAAMPKHLPSACAADGVTQAQVTP